MAPLVWSLLLGILGQSITLSIFFGYRRRLLEEEMEVTCTVLDAIGIRQNAIDLKRYMDNLTNDRRPVQRTEGLVFKYNKTFDINAHRVERDLLAADIDSIEYAINNFNSQHTSSDLRTITALQMKIHELNIQIQTNISCLCHPDDDTSFVDIPKLEQDLLALYKTRRFLKKRVAEKNSENTISFEVNSSWMKELF